MKVRGIKRGQTIELSEAVDFPDGIELTIELEILAKPAEQTDQSLSDAEKLAKLNQVFGAWKDQPDLDENFAEIDRERHAYRGRQINLFEQQDDA
jgi:hypothetical protein